MLGHSDDVATLKAIQTIVHSMSAVKQTEDPLLKSSYLSSEWIQQRSLAVRPAMFFDKIVDKVIYMSKRRCEQGADCEEKN